MTALTQEVLKDMSLPSGSFPIEPPKPIVDATPIGGIVEESQDEPEETLTEPELQQIVGKALGIHPRSAEMADKLQAWLEARKLNWGLQIRTIKGEERTKIPYGFDWVTTSPTTILAITLDYHENPFWQHSPVVVRLRQFLHRENCELVRRDASRWYVVEKLPHLEEAVTP